MVLFVISKFFFYLLYHDNSKNVNKDDFQTKLEKCVENLDDALKKSRDIFPSCKTQYEFARLWVYGLRVSNVENMIIPEAISVDYTKDELKNYNIEEEYYYKPVVHTFDRTSYYLLKFEPLCPNVDLINPYNSSCIITIDVNDFKTPNNKGEDRFDYIFDGTDYKLIFIKELLENKQ